MSSDRQQIVNTLDRIQAAYVPTHLWPTMKPFPDEWELVDMHMTEAPTQIKQVIVMRHDLKMRRGKQIAQGAHASMSFLCRRLQNQQSVSLDDFSEIERTWLTGSFAKVCCRVNSEAELLSIYDQATTAGIEVHLITDSGKTEFHGQPTRTCLAIGPDLAERIDPITGHLELL